MNIQQPLPVMKVQEIQVALPFKARVVQIVQAYKDGQTAALALKIGDVYMGPGPLAKQAYPDDPSQMSYIDGFLDVADKMKIECDHNNRVVGMYRRTVRARSRE